jgi:hypothetical protein
MFILEFGGFLFLRGSISNIFIFAYVLYDVSALVSPPGAGGSWLMGFDNKSRRGSGRVTQSAEPAWLRSALYVAFVNSPLQKCLPVHVCAEITECTEIENNHSLARSSVGDAIARQNLGVRTLRCQAGGGSAFASQPPPAALLRPPPVSLIFRIELLRASIVLLSTRVFHVHKCMCVFCDVGVLLLNLVASQDAHQAMFYL